jgi:hypothetical protein
MDKQTGEKGEKSGMTRQEQIDYLLPPMRKMAPDIINIAAMYNKAYPPATTSGDVLDAVTVAVPYRHFMVMASIAVNTLLLHQPGAAANDDSKPKTDPEAA